MEHRNKQRGSRGQRVRKGTGGNPSNQGTSGGRRVVLPSSSNASAAARAIPPQSPAPVPKAPASNPASLPTPSGNPVHREAAPSVEQPQVHGAPEIAQVQPTTQTAGVSPDVHAMMAFEANKKSTGLAYVLWFFLGAFGVHRFYVGKVGSGVGMLLLWFFGFLTSLIFIGLFLLLAWFIWWIVDAFLLAGIVERKNNELAQRIRGGGMAGL